VFAAEYAWDGFPAGTLSVRKCDSVHTSGIIVMNRRCRKRSRQLWP